MIIIRRPKFAILKNEDPFDHLNWVKSCQNHENDIDYQVIDLTAINWLDLVNDYSPDILLLKPSGKTSIYRALYQERLEILVNVLDYRSFPSINEVRIYENKRYFAYWAEANKIPHPQTFVFYKKKEALSALSTFSLPLVGKINIGASGKGVRVLYTRDDVKKYINQAFDKGLISRTGPKLQPGKLFQRVWQKIKHPNHLLNRLKTYKDIAADRQLGFVILQQYIPHDYEWRVVRIGNSYFAHKKMVLNGKASGSLLKEYADPPKDLLDFIHVFTDKFGFTCVAIDLFEPTLGTYLINEIQCIFGQSDPHQMIVDGKPGRYLFQEGHWVFEEGAFNTNESFDLRVKTAMELYVSGSI